MRKALLLFMILFLFAFQSLPVRAINEVELVLIGYYSGSTITLGPLLPDTLYVIDLSYPNDTQSLGTPLMEIRPSSWNATRTPMYSINFEILLSNPVRAVFYSLSGGSFTLQANGQFASPPAFTLYEVISTTTDYNSLIAENNKLKNENVDLEIENGNQRFAIESLRLNSNYLIIALIAVSIVFIPSTFYLALRSSKRKPDAIATMYAGGEETEK